MENFRYLLLILGALSVGFVYCNRVAFNFTVICQEPANKTEISDYYLADSANKAWMFTANALGMTFGTLPLYLAYKLETRFIIIFYAALSILSSVLYPLADSLGYWPAFISRFFSGVAFAGQMHVINEFALRWSSKSETSFFFAILLSTSQIGPLVAMALGGEMCSSSLGWEATYYILALFTTLITAAFCVLYSDDVAGNRFCSEDEKKTILEGKEAISRKKAHVPYFDLLTDKGVMACFFLFTGYYIGMMVYQMYSPTFIKQVLNFSIRETGWFSGIPMLVAIFLKIALGKVLDHGLGLSQKWRFFGPLLILEAASTLSIFLTGFADSRVTSLIFMLIFASIHAIVPVVYGRTLQIICGQHAHFALNLNIVVAGVVQILLPGGVHLLTPDNSKDEWSRLFYIVAFLCVLTSVVYIAFAEPKSSKWAVDEKQKDSQKE